MISRTYRVAVEPQISNKLFGALVLQGHLPEQRVKFVQSWGIQMVS